MSDAHSNVSKTDVNVLRERIVALQKSASNLVQMDLSELSAMLPPDTSRERLIEIRAKLLQLHRLQNSRNDGQSESENVNSSADGVTNRSSRYKTELCRPFEENGVCKYGARCQFAHGLAELRNLARHPKYKSQLCRTFHSNGLCPYGHRCHFIHNQDEIRGGASSKPLGMQANRNYTDVNMNNAQRNDVYAELVCNEWGRRANFSNSSSDTFRKLPPSSLMQSLMPRPRPALEMPIPPAMPVQNGFKPLSTGCSLGSAGELSPPVSPIVYSPEDPFLSQTAIRHGYFASGVLGESSEFKLNQMLAFTKFPGSLSGPCTQTSAPSFGRASQSPENPQPISAQVVPPHLWWNGEGL